MQIPLLIQKFSGVIGMLIVWIILVGYPFFHRDLGYLKETISALGEKKRNVFIAITFALLTGNIFQLIFLSYIQNKYVISSDSYGSILYLGMCLASFFAAIFVPKHNPKLHLLAAACYFVIVPITMLAVGWGTISYGTLIFYVSVVLSIMYALVSLFILTKHGKTNAMLEIFCFFTVSVWALFLTFY